jgi:hypothetical protein
VLTTVVSSSKVSLGCKQSDEVDRQLSSALPDGRLRRTRQQLLPLMRARPLRIGPAFITAACNQRSLSYPISSGDQQLTGSPASHISALSRNIEQQAL